MTDPARQPAGTGAGGQFAPTGRDEADVDVSRYSEPDGTMFFPARFETAEDHLRWWRKVEVPDEILQDVTDSYPRSREVQSVLYMGGGWRRMPQDPSWSESEYASRQQESLDAHQAKRAKFLEDVPKEIDRFKVRDAVRLHLAWKYAYTLPAEEQEKLAEEKVSVGDLRGTLPSFDSYFAMGGYDHSHPEVFTKLPGQKADSSKEIEAALSRMRHEISETKRLAEVGLRTQHIVIGTDPATSAQIIAGEKVTAKPKSVRQGSKEWAKAGKKR